MAIVIACPQHQKPSYATDRISGNINEMKNMFKHK
jgi:hypothetical protein